MKTTFQASDIIWIKNVTAQPNPLAPVYMGATSKFELEFPRKFKKNAKHPIPNEIIILFQKINEKQYFSHLVSPIDDNVFLTNSKTHPWGRHVKIIAKKLIAISHTQWNNVKFNGARNGNVCRIANMKNIDSAGLLQDIWDEFHR